MHAWKESIVVFLVAGVSFLVPSAWGKEPEACSVLRISTDSGFCEALVCAVPNGGCTIGRESETVVRDDWQSTFDGMGSQFVECGGRSLVCGVPYVCDCKHRSQVVKPKQIKRKKQP